MAPDQAKPDDRLTPDIIGGDVVRIGAVEMEVRYRPVSRTIDESWSAQAFARYESREFRLDDDGPIPDGVFRDDIVLLGVGTTWAPASSRMTVAFDLGASIYRDMDVLDAGGDEIVDTERVDPAFFLSARLEYRF